MNTLKERISSAGLTVKQLSEITGISTPRLYNYMTGASTPNAYTAAKIASALNCQSHDIFPEPIKTKTRLREIMSERGITQEELAKKTGLSFVTVNRAVGGYASEASLHKIADTLNVVLEEIMVEDAPHVAASETTIRCPYCGKEIGLITTKME